jgi:diguanylate cyclase (GGDEF)-like protein/PAS domain S-box-containing protein
MKTPLTRWFSPPVFANDEDQTRRANLLNLVILISLTFVSLTVLGDLLGGRTPQTTLVIDGLSFITCLGLRHLMNRGRVTLAGIGFVVFGSILLTTTIISLGTIRTPSTSIFLLIIILAGLMFGPAGLTATVTASSLAVLGLLRAENAGWLPKPDYTVTLTQWVTYTTLFALTGGLTFLMHRSAQKALQVAHQELLERKQAEAALHTSQRFTQAVLDSLSAHLCVLDEHGAILAVNQAWNTFAQENSGAVFLPGGNTNYLEICERTTGEEAQVAQDFAAGIRAVLSGAQEQFEREYPCHAPFTQHWFLGRVTRFYEEDRPRAVIAHENITQRKLSERALRASEERYRSLVTAMSEGVILQNTRGEMMTCNPTAERLLGLTHLQMAGQTCLNPDWRVIREDGSIFPDEAHPTRITLRTGQALRNIVMGFQPPAGESIWINLNTEPLFNPGETQPGAVVTSFSDITARRRTESLLQASKINFSTFFEQVDDLLFVLDLDGNILKANATACRRLGYQEMELLGQPMLAMHPPEQREEARAILSKIQVGKCQECLIPLMDRGGSLIEVETRITRSKWDDHEAFFGVCKDVSALKRSEEKFSKAFQISSALMAISTLQEGRYVDVNEAFCTTLGYKKSEVIGKTAVELSIFEDLDQRQFLLEDLKEHGSLHNLEFKIHCCDGRTLDGLFSAEKIDLQGSPHLLTIFIDISKRKKAEAALRESEQLLRSFATNISGLVFIIDKEGIVRLCEGRGLTELGIQPRMAVGMSIYQAHKQIPQIQELFQQTLKGQEQQTIIPVGDLIFEIYANPILDHQGRVTGILSIAQNITERKRLEDELRNQHDFLEQVINNMGQGLTVTNAERQFELVNPAYARLFGYTPGEIIGRHPGDVTIVPDQAVLETAHTARLRGETTTYESGLIRADGTIAPVLITGAPRWKDGKIIGAIAVITDLTEIKRVQDALRQSEERLRFLGNNLPDSIVYQYTRRLDSLPQFTYVSEGVERLLGLTSAEVIGNPGLLIQRISLDQAPAILEAEALSATTLSAFTLEILVNSVQGEQRWVQLRSRPHLAAEGQLVWDGVVTDITQHMILEAELHADNLQLQKRVKQLYNLQNELRDQALHDPLTQLYNRRGLDEILPREMARARRKNYENGLLMIDIDFFKQVNDRYGHTAGDEALQAVARLILANLRASDVVCRFGGEEILCLLLNTSKKSLLSRAEALRQAVAGLPILQTHPEARLTISIGAMVIAPHEHDFPALLKTVDEALYQAKASGRNCVRLAQSQAHPKTRD